MSVKLRWQTNKKSRKSAYLDIYHNGARNREFLKIYIDKNDPDSKEKKMLAESIRAKKELQLTSEEHGYTPKFKKEADLLTYFEKYIENYPNKDKRLVVNAINKFRELLISKKLIKKDKFPAKNLSPQICEAYAQYLKSDECGLTGETPHNYWTKFRMVLSNAVKDKILVGNPSDGIKVPKKRGQIKKTILTEEEIQKLANTTCGNAEVKRAFLFACFTGLGMAEIRKLTYKRVQDNKLIIFREKTGEQIINDLHPTAQNLIGELGEPDALVFSDMPSDNGINKTLKYWVKRAEIDKKITFYCARHTFAILLLLNGASVRAVQDCMGHADIRSTMQYLNYVDSLKSEAISRLPQIQIG